MSLQQSHSYLKTASAHGLSQTLRIGTPEITSLQLVWTSLQMPEELKASMEQLKGAQGQGLAVFEEGGPSSADQAFQQVGKTSC